MRENWIIFMLLVTLLIGLFFLSSVPSDQESLIFALETRIADLEGTITALERGGTPIPPTPTVDQTLNAEILRVTETPTPLPTQIPVVVANDTGVVAVQASTQVDGAGCALNPATSFAAFDSIYGVATLVDMVVGDTIQVRFDYVTQDTVIYQDVFTVEEPGNFCRWFLISPDEVGWEAGAYRISFAVNDAVPVEMTYSVQ